MQRTLFTRTDLQYIIPPISDAFVYKEYFYALYKQFNFDIYLRIVCFMTIN